MWSGRDEEDRLMTQSSAVAQVARRASKPAAGNVCQARLIGAALGLVLAALSGAWLAAPAHADWTAPIPIDPGNSLEAITCTSATTCIALDSAGNLLSSTANGQGPAFQSAWSSPTPIGFTGNGGTFTALSCPQGLTFCAAFDSNGNV